jgi:uncharacterized membrane protein YvbJ
MITERIKRGVFYYCSNCGAEVLEAAEVCPDCGLVFGGTRYDSPADMPSGVRKLRTAQRQRAYVILAVLLTALAAIVLRSVCTH